MDKTSLLEIGSWIAGIFSFILAIYIFILEKPRKSNKKIMTGIKNGVIFRKGFLSTYFVDSTDMTVNLKYPLILLYHKELYEESQVLKAIKLATKSARPLFIIAENITGTALEYIVKANITGQCKNAAVATPGESKEDRINMLNDLAILTGGTSIGDETGSSIELIDIQDFGTAESIKITESNTTIKNGSGIKDEIQLRISQIKLLGKNETNKMRLSALRNNRHYSKKSTY